MTLEKRDKLILCGILAMSLLFWAWQQLAGGQMAAGVGLVVNGVEIFAYSEATPGQAQVWQFSGPVGGVLLAYEPGRGFHVVEAVCPDQSCRKTGYIHRPGQAIVCVPNQISIRLIGAQGEEGLDGILR